MAFKNLHPCEIRKDGDPRKSFNHPIYRPPYKIRIDGHGFLSELADQELSDTFAELRNAGCPILCDFQRVGGLDSS